MKPVVLLLLTLVVSATWAQEQANRTTQGTTQKAFTSVERVGEDPFRSFYMFSVSGHDYTIRADGRGERSFANARSRNFTLMVDQGRIEQVYFLEYDDDLFLIYQLSNRRDARGYVVRLNQKTLKFIWSKPVNELHMEAAVVEAGFLNLKTANAVMKLDLQSGAIVEN
jgi:hypothetical protein